MADIKQAAAWLREGHVVRRKQYEYKWWVDTYHPKRIALFVACTVDGNEHELDCLDLLAEDWELAN